MSSRGFAKVPINRGAQINHIALGEIIIRGQKRFVIDLTRKKTRKTHT